MFSKHTQISNFMKIRTLGTEVFHEGQRDEQSDRRTDRHDESNSSFSKFCRLA